MQNVLILFAHPNQGRSQANKAMAKAARQVEGITFADLYAEYPTFKIDVDREQERLLKHHVIVMQFPVFWYSTPSVIKEWMDLSLEYGFAYGEGGDKLAGKTMMIAATTGGSAEAYSEAGYHEKPLRELLSPLEQTARFCNMVFPAPYILFGATHAEEDGRLSAHVDGYADLLRQLRDGAFDVEAARSLTFLDHTNFPLKQEG